MENESTGLTGCYTQVSDRQNGAAEVDRIRELHLAIDLAVTDGFGWGDLDLDHGFHETRWGYRFTLGPVARVEILDRLLEVNQERLEAQGGESASTSDMGLRPVDPPDGSLFGLE